MIFNCHRASYSFRIRCTLFQKMAGRSDKPYSLVKTRVWLWLSLASFYDSRVSCSNTWNYFCQKVLVPMQSKNGRNGVAWCGVQKSNWCDFSHSLAVRLTEEIAFAKRQWLDFSGVDEFAKLQPISFVVVVVGKTCWCGMNMRSAKKTFPNCNKSLVLWANFLLIYRSRKMNQILIQL